MSIKTKLKNFDDWLFEWLDAGMGVFVAGFILLVILIFVGIVYAIYQSYASEKIELQKAHWVCVQTKPRVSVTYVKSGEVLIPIETVIDECVNYQRTY